jgi:hypothetical protein
VHLWGGQECNWNPKGLLTISTLKFYGLMFEWAFLVEWLLLRQNNKFRNVAILGVLKIKAVW